MLPTEVTDRNGTTVCMIAAILPKIIFTPNLSVKAKCARQVSLTDRRYAVKCLFMARLLAWISAKSVYFAPINATVVSSIRLENPHSLSYQALTFTSRPDTLVKVASNDDEWLSWLKSIETSGAVL